MINAELAARSGNKRSLKALKSYIPAKEKNDLKIAFNCECANPDCKARIALTLKEYEQLHQNSARFVVAKGHTEPKIEKIKRSSKNIAVVEKHALS